MPIYNSNNNIDLTKHKYLDLSLSAIKKYNLYFNIYISINKYSNYSDLPPDYKILHSYKTIPVQMQYLALSLLQLDISLLDKIQTKYNPKQAYKDIEHKINHAYRQKSVQVHPDKAINLSPYYSEIRAHNFSQLKNARDLLIYQNKLNYNNLRKFGLISWHLTGLNNLKSAINCLTRPTKNLLETFYNDIKEVINYLKDKNNNIVSKLKYVAIKILKEVLLIIPRLTFLVVSQLVCFVLASINFTLGLSKILLTPFGILYKKIKNKMIERDTKGNEQNKTLIPDNNSKPKPSDESIMKPNSKSVHSNTRPLLISYVTASNSSNVNSQQELTEQLYKECEKRIGLGLD